MPMVAEMRPANRITASWTPHGLIQSYTVRLWLDEVPYQTVSGVKVPAFDIDVMQAAASIRVAKARRVEKVMAAAPVVER